MESAKACNRPLSCSACNGVGNKQDPRLCASSEVSFCSLRTIDLSTLSKSAIRMTSRDELEAEGIKLGLAIGLDETVAK